MKVLKLSLATLLVAAGCAATAHAAFIVEAHSSGKANANFAIIPGAGNATTATASTLSIALGLSATNSIFGSNNTVAATVDKYRFSYTPGTNADNTIYALGAALGNTSAADGDGLGPLVPVYANVPQLATGQTGGVSGLYKVYFTVPASTNVNVAGSRMEITSDLPTVALNPVNLNSGGTGLNTNTNPAGAYLGGANNRWLHVATVHLTAGNTYSFTLTSNADSQVSQRAHGVMWELQTADVIIPEPSSFALAAFALVGMVAAARRKMVA